MSCVLRPRPAALTPDNLPVPALPLDWADAALPPPDRPEQWPQVLAPVAGRRRDIIAADVIYDPDIVPLLVAAIRVLLTEDGGGHTPIAVVAATVRNPDTFKLFLDTCCEFSHYGCGCSLMSSALPEIHHV